MDVDADGNLDGSNNNTNSSKGDAAKRARLEVIKQPSQGAAGSGGGGAELRALIVGTRIGVARNGEGSFCRVRVPAFMLNICRHAAC